MDEETTTMAPQAEKPAASRRKFLTGAAATAAGATTVLAAPNVSRAQTVTIKMQGAWARQDILNEFAEDYVDRVNEMGGGRLKIDYLIVGRGGEAVQRPRTRCIRACCDAGHHRRRVRLRQEQGGVAVRDRAGLLGLERAPGPRLDPRGRR